MLKLFSKSLTPLAEINEPAISIRRLADSRTDVPALRGREYFLVRNGDSIPEGYQGYFFFKSPDRDTQKNSFLLDEELAYLRGGDVVKLDPGHNYLRTLYRRNSLHNHFLITERCNNYCLMCSQPPRDIDDSYIAGEILQTIPLISRETKSIGITGGEPSMSGTGLFEIVRALKSYLPAAAVHVLSNGRNFKDFALAQTLAEINHPDFAIGIPVYSDLPWQHDYVVQADGAFDDTIRGILNLKGAGVKVEIRVVIHKITAPRLPSLARFIRRNLTFCDHVALMGLEITGFTRSNLEKLWIDPKDYQPQLKEAVEVLSQAKMAVSVYNHQLCVLDESIRPFSRKSISDWKNEYMPECEGCTRRIECGGFFSSAKVRYSSHIKPFRE